ncbi:hypothetical protein GCM10007874_28200 [Labrys miyagiensis]|uniref:Uncharacterized protein n=1 Tax=Labrys miyagiensis TaxID=346912 RepID=A0ABQ6CHH6_9HYPH|nr:hypothetical protein [Labrys miyagiensis]GLS19803.1 hypothetical protein GCM10007874_28200 [Labrys miyagiensis]
MSAARKIHSLTFHLFGLADEDAADELLDDVEEFADGMTWPFGQPDAYKYLEDEADDVVKCAVEFKVRAAIAGSAIEAEKRDFEAAMALIEYLRQLSLSHSLDIEVDFDEETIGSIDKGVFSASLHAGLIEPWAAALAS